jgi:hypothetical protein
LEFLRSFTQEEIENAVNPRWKPYTDALRGARPPKAFRDLYEEFVAQPTRETLALFLDAARATADFYLENSCRDGVPMWDTGAPNLHRLGDYLRKKSDPYNQWEPVDSSAAAIAAQGFIRLGNYLTAHGRRKDGGRYRQAGLTIANTLLDEPYLATGAKHQGLLLHSVYHRPNGWDYIAPGQNVPNGESSMWGDYHARELALLILREARGEPYLTFFDSTSRPA